LANTLLVLPHAIEEEIRKTPKPKDAIIPFGNLAVIHEDCVFGSTFNSLLIRNQENSYFRKKVWKKP